MPEHTPAAPSPLPSSPLAQETHSPTSRLSFTIHSTKNRWKAKEITSRCQSTLLS
jgi:hypothetical protein